METEILDILIVERDGQFLQKLKNVLEEIEWGSYGFEIEISEPQTTHEIEAAFYKDRPKLAFMDYDDFLVYEKQLIELVTVTENKFHIVMLVNGNSGVNFYEILKNLEEHKLLKLCGQLLKENYSKELIAVLIRSLIKKIALNVC